MLRQFRHKLVSQCTDLGNQERPLSAQSSGCGDPIWTRNGQYVQKTGYGFWLPISIKKAEGICNRPLYVKFRLTRKESLFVSSTRLLNRPCSQLVPRFLWTKIWIYLLVWRVSTWLTISLLAPWGLIFIYSEKATKFEKRISQYSNVKKIGIFFQNFVAFSECLN